MLSIQQAILHILDKNSGNLFLSDHIMNLEDGYVQDYINRLVVKTQKSDVKKGTLLAESAIYTLLHSEQSFVELSHTLAHKIYQIMAPAEQIPAADYLFFEAKDEAESLFYGIIRLDYQTSFTHFLNVEEGISNQLIQNHAILPNPTSKPLEAFILNKSTLTYELLEKKFEIEGTKQFYFSEQVLGIIPPEATPTQIKQIRKTVNSVAKRFDEPAYEKMALAQKEIFEQLDDTNEIDTQRVIEKVFYNNLGALTSAKNDFEEQKVPEKIVVTNVPKYEKKYQKQKYKLSNGIELSIPIELYDNKEIVEFINQPDGKISVVIKNIDSMLNRFNG